MNVIIVDDDPISSELLKIYVERTDSLKLVGTYAGTREAISALNEGKQIDLILFDIDTPGKNSFEFLNSLKEIPGIIVVSNKKDHAAEAYDNNAIDYLAKPVNYDRFLKGVKKVEKARGCSLFNDKGVDFIFIRNKNRLQRVSMHDIEYAEANADYVNIVTSDHKYVVHSSMKNIEAKFPQRKFIRVHRSFIVNLDKIIYVEENTLYLGEKGVPIGRLYKEHILEKLNLL